VCKAGVWYLVARRDGELRTYRVSRVQEVVMRDEQFARPADFDLAAYWQQSVSGFESQQPPVEVEVRATDWAVGELRWYARTSGVVCTEHPSDDASGDDDERIRCTVAFESHDDAFRDLLRLGADVEVLAPAPLRERMSTASNALATLYR
jgi:predicted DNA-binding transcriptional regulator YafY